MCELGCGAVRGSSGRGVDRRLLRGAASAHLVRCLPAFLRRARVAAADLLPGTGLHTSIRFTVRAQHRGSSGLPEGSCFAGSDVLQWQALPHQATACRWPARSYSQLKYLPVAGEAEGQTAGQPHWTLSRCWQGTRVACHHSVLLVQVSCQACFCTPELQCHTQRQSQAEPCLRLIRLLGRRQDSRTGRSGTLRWRAAAVHRPAAGLLQLLTLLYLLLLPAPQPTWVSSDQRTQHSPRGWSAAAGGLCCLRCLQSAGLRCMS